MRILSDLRGAARLACDATIGVTSVVERVHGNVLSLPPIISKREHRSGAGPARLVYNAIRGTTRLVRGTLDLGLAPWATDDFEASSPAVRDAVIAALNGVCGDHLQRSGNPLATTMRLQQRSTMHAGAAPIGERRLLVLVHGLCMNDRQWTRDGHDHGRALEQSLGLAPLYLRYNSGLGVDENGRRLAELLELRVNDVPGAIASIDLLGYSLGGLLCRSAYEHASQQQYRWPGLLRKMIFLGTPHDGAPLERGGHLLDQVLRTSPYLVPFSVPSSARSRGIQNLRHGLQAAAAPLPHDVECFAIAGSLAENHTRPGAAWVGDGLVPVASALGQGRKGHTDLNIPQHRQWIAPSTGHLDLLGNPAVFEKLRDWLAEP